MSNNQSTFCRFKSWFGWPTKHDLKEMEKRLTDAIKENAHVSPGIESAAMRAQSALDKLDASIPDKR